MKIKRIVIASAVIALCCLLFFRYINLVREPAQSGRRAQLFKRSAQCALETLLPGDSNALRERAQLTLDFAYRRLFQKITDYKIDTSQEEIAHFMAQILQETGYLQYMVEDAGGQTWEHAMDTATPSGWNCGTYHAAIVSDRNFF